MTPHKWVGANLGLCSRGAGQRCRSLAAPPPESRVVGGAIDRSPRGHSPRQSRSRRHRRFDVPQHYASGSSRRAHHSRSRWCGSRRRRPRRPCMAASAAPSPTRAAARCLASPSRSPASSARPWIRVVTNESGFYVEGPPDARQLRGQGGARGFQDGGRPDGPGQRRHADARQLQSGGRAADRDRGGHRRIAAAQDRPRGRGDPLRHEGAHRAAGPRSQLHQVRPADAGHAAARAGSTPRPRTLRGRRRRRSTASTSAAPATSSTAPRTAIRSSASSSSTRISSRSARRKITSQNYDAEFGQATAGVVSVQTKSGTNDVPRQRVRVLPERGAAGAQPVHAVAAESPHRQVHPRHEAEPVRRLGRRAHRCRTSGSSSATTRARAGQGRLAAAHGADGARAHRELQRLRRPIFDPAHRTGQFPNATHSQPTDCHRRRSPS